MELYRVTSQSYLLAVGGAASLADRPVACAAQMRVDGVLVTADREAWPETLHSARVGLFGLKRVGHGMTVRKARLTVGKPTCAWPE